MCPAPNLTTTADASPLAAPQYQAPQPIGGLYGPRGWTVTAGVWRLLPQRPDRLRDLHHLSEEETEASPVIDITGAPLDDYVPFTGLDAAGAAELLAILPKEALEDRQNLGPSLKTLLRACMSGQGQVRLSGYAIGPQRHDERVSVEAIWVSDPTLAGFKLNPTHAPGCDCHALWERVSVRYQLDAQGMPDEILRRSPAWADGEEGWWFWWD